MIHIESDMTPEQWETIGTIVAIPVSVIAIITAAITVLRRLMNRRNNRYLNKLSKEELNCIQSFESQDGSWEWSEGMDKRMLKICESLVKKQYLEEWSSSPSRAMVVFGLTEKGKESYKKVLLTGNTNLMKAIRSAKKIFPSEISSTSSASELDVHKTIRVMEEEGTLIPIKSDNRGTLFWVHKN